MKRLSLKALIAGTIIMLVLYFAISVVFGFLIKSDSEIAWLIVDILVTLVSVFTGAIIAGRLAPKAGSTNGTAVAVLAWILFTVLLFVFGDVETAITRIQGWYWIFFWAAFGGFGGSIGTRWAESRMSAQGWVDRGNEFSQKGVYQRALECYDRALQIDPENSAAVSLKSSTESKLKTVREQEYEISKERYGSFAVNKIHMVKPNVQYAFIFTRDRLIAAKIGGQSATVAQTEKLEELKSMPANTILEADKKNFEIRYDQISKLEVKKSSIGKSGARSGVIKITGKEKAEYDIAAGQVYEDCVQIIQSALPTKLELK